MAKASVPLMKAEYKRRAVNVDRDDTEGMSRLVNAVGISPKAANNGCIGFIAMLIAALVVAAGMLS